MSQAENRIDDTHKQNVEYGATNGKCDSSWIGDTMNTEVGDFSDAQSQSLIAVDPALHCLGIGAVMETEQRCQYVQLQGDGPNQCPESETSYSCAGRGWREGLHLKPPSLYLSTNTTVNAVRIIAPSTIRLNKLITLVHLLMQPHYRGLCVRG